MTGRPSPQQKRRSRTSRALGGVALLAISAAASAGVVTDGSLGTASALPGPRFAIPAGLGRVAGPNLFHSFSTFSLAASESAQFSGPASIANVISRVTGPDASVIDGRIGCDIAGANLFLSNPRGIVFGPNASLDLSGSFHAGTADYVRMADGSRFHADPVRPSLLGIAPPAAFGFLAAAPAPIVVDGAALGTAPGRALTLAAGRVDLDGRGGGGALRTPGGSLTLVASGAGEWTLGGQGAAPADAAHRIRVADGMRLDASGAGGRIVIRGGQFRVERSVATAQATDAGAAGAIDVEVAGDVELVDSTLQSATAGPHAAGRIAIRADRLLLDEGSRVDTSTFGSGAGGTVAIEVGDAGIAGGSRVRNNVETDAGGRGGHTDVVVRGTLVVDGADSAISTTTFGDGAGGTLSIRAGEIVVRGGSLQAATTTGADAGSVDVDVGRLALAEGGSIIVGTFGDGHGGRVSVRASGGVAIEGTSSDGSASQIHAATWGGSGDGGSISVTAGSVTLANDGSINGIAYGAGRAATVTVRADTLTIADGGDITTESYLRSPGGGTITVDAGSIAIAGRGEGRSASPGSDRVSTGIHTFAADIAIRAASLTMTDSGAITARTWSDNPGGQISVHVARLDLRDGAQINAESMGHSGYLGRAGNIDVTATESIRIAGEVGDRYSGIRVGTRSSGDGGRIDLRTPLLEIGTGGSVNSATGVFGYGSAGDIVIEADTVRLPGGGILSSSNGSGAGGSISVRATRAIDIDGGSISAYGDLDGMPGQVTLVTPHLEVANRGSISTSTYGSRPAGDIAIAATRIELHGGSAIRSESTTLADAGTIGIEASARLESDGSSITTAASRASGGNIAIRTPTLVLRGASAVSATVFGGTGDGGNVDVAATRVAALGDSDVTARADQGFGGRITLGAEVFLRAPDVDLDASSNVAGNEGVVAINAPTLDLTGAVLPLSAGLRDDVPLRSDACAGRIGQGVSSLVLVGRGGVPPDPASWLFTIEPPRARAPDAALPHPPLARTATPTACAPKADP